MTLFQGFKATINIANNFFQSVKTTSPQSNSFSRYLPSRCKPVVTLDALEMTMNSIYKIPTLVVVHSAISHISPTVY